MSTRYYLVKSKANGAAARIVQAKSAAAVKAHVYADQWSEPEVARIDDVARAASDGIKPEVVSESAQG